MWYNYKKQMLTRQSNHICTSYFSQWQYQQNLEKPLGPSVLDMWSAHSESASDHHSTAFAPQTQKRSPSFREESLAYVSIKSSESTVVGFKARRRPKPMCCQSLQCVWLVDLSAALQEHRWLRGTKRELKCSKGPLSGYSLVIVFDQMNWSLM